MKTVMKTFMIRRKWRILGRILKHQLRVLARLADRQNSRSGGSWCSHEGVHDCRTDFGGLAHGAGPAERRRRTHHLLKGFMAAIMNPFMIPLWDSGGRIGFDDGRVRHKRAAPSIPAPKTSAESSLSRPTATSSSRRTRPPDLVGEPTDRVLVKATQHLIKGFMVE